MTIFVYQKQLWALKQVQCSVSGLIIFLNFDQTNFVCLFLTWFKHIVILKNKDFKKLAGPVIDRILYNEKNGFTWAYLWTKDPDPFFTGSGSGDPKRLDPTGSGSAIDSTLLEIVIPDCH